MHLSTNAATSSEGMVREGFEPSVHNPPERVIANSTRCLEIVSKSVSIAPARSEPTGLEPAMRKPASFYPPFLSTLAKYPLADCHRGMLN
jgi:hypothetical protein